MSEDWAAVAAEVEAAIRSVGDITQPDGYPAVLRKMVETDGDPYDPDAGTIAPAYTTIRILEDNRRIRDATGTLIDRVDHVITVGTGSGVVPADEDMIAMGITAEEASDTSDWIGIDNIVTTAPAGIALMYEITLAR
jgi:hypothetical protein